MKYYKFQGDLFQIQENRWEILNRVEPSVVELTKEDYENGMGIKPQGTGAKKDQDGGRNVGKNPKAKAKTSVQVGRPEAIKTLRAKGHEYKDLKSKTKAELNAML